MDFILDYLSLPMDVLLSTNTDVRKHPQFHSDLLEGERDLVVYVPKDYDVNLEARYPVLYLHDGQNLFDPGTSYGGVDWRVDKTAEMLVQNNTIEPIIIVGIYNTGHNRIKEYTPTRDRKHGGGYADVYGRMITQEIKPFIEKTYRTLGGAQNTGLGGSSLGGLVSLYLGLQYPDCFGKIAVMSPSVWWNNRHILKFVEKLETKPDLKIWLDIGTAEGEKALADARLLRQALVQKGWKEGLDLRYAEARGATHSEGAWAARVAPMLHYLFPTPVAVA